MTEGQKATKTRDALRAAIDQLPDTAHKPRHDLREVLNAPSLVLAILYDAIKAQG